MVLDEAEKGLGFHKKSGPGRKVPVVVNQHCYGHEVIEGGSQVPMSKIVSNQDGVEATLGVSKEPQDALLGDVGPPDAL